MIHGTLRATTLVLLLAAPTCDITSPDLDAEGVVRFLDVEGGCWGIESQGEMFEPLDVPEAFREDGLAISFEAEVKPDVATICQIGTPIDLLRIAEAR
jgi:hypothetical protein